MLVERGCWQLCDSGLADETFGAKSGFLGGVERVRSLHEATVGKTSNRQSIIFYYYHDDNHDSISGLTLLRHPPRAQSGWTYLAQGALGYNMCALSECPR